MQNETQLVRERLRIAPVGAALPVAPAERAPGPVFTVPLISEGTTAPDAASGVPRTGGALEFLQLGSGQVFWQELWFDLGGQPGVSASSRRPNEA